MTPEERIERHKDTIARLREDAEWINETGFSFSTTSGETTANLVGGIKQQIAVYEQLIARLEL